MCDGTAQACRLIHDDEILLERLKGHAFVMRTDIVVVRLCYGGLGDLTRPYESPDM